MFLSSPSRFLRTSLQLLSLAFIFIENSGEAANEILNVNGWPKVVYVDGGNYQPGASQDELLFAAALCLREGGGSECEPDTFAVELSDWAQITVNGFFIDRHEVSVGQFKDCVAQGLCDYSLPLQLANEYPMTHISFDEAQNYCQVNGGTLPSELQFEFAASLGGSRRYPWGNAAEVKRANWGQRGVGEYNALDGYRASAPSHAQTFDSTPHGIFNMAGNVAEWTSASQSWFRGGSDERSTIIRGGHFRAPASKGRNFTREPSYRGRREAYLGFRCIY